MIPTRRMLHSKIWHSDQFAMLKPLEGLLYIGMITLGDDEGRLRGDGRFLKSQLFPYSKIGVRQVETMRNRIAEIGLIVVYPSQNGTCIWHPNWTKYQILRHDRAKPSEFPPPPVANSPPSGNQTSTQTQDKESQTEESGRDSNKTEGESFRKGVLGCMSEKTRAIFDRQRVDRSDV